MTSYTQYQLSNVSPAAIQSLAGLQGKYKYELRIDQTTRVLTILTTDTSLITLIDSKNVTGITKTTVTVPEYDDTLSVSDVEALIESKSDLSSVRPELVAKAQANLNPSPAV